MKDEESLSEEIYWKSRYGEIEIETNITGLSSTAIEIVLQVIIKNSADNSLGYRLDNIDIISEHGEFLTTNIASSIGQYFVLRSDREIVDDDFSTLHIPAKNEKWVRVEGILMPSKDDLYYRKELVKQVGTLTLKLGEFQILDDSEFIQLQIVPVKKTLFFKKEL